LKKQSTPLPWSDGEIRASYRQARNPDEQVYILADLNACTPKRICEILHIPVPKRPSSNMARYVRHEWTEEEDRLITVLSELDYTDRVIANRLHLPIGCVSARRKKICGSKGGRRGKKRRL